MVNIILSPFEMKLILNINLHTLTDGSTLINVSIAFISLD